MGASHTTVQQATFLVLAPSSIQGVDAQKEKRDSPAEWPL